VQIQADSSTVPPVTANSVLSATASANPSVVSVNLDGSSTNQAEVRALFLGANNARIPNIRVRFDLNGDTNSIGGTLTSGTTMVYSDANGFATTAYVPAKISSPTNGLTVRACWDYADFAAGTCPHSTTTQLTVVSQALKVSIGTDELIQLGTGTYIKDYVVMVVDAAGRAVAGVDITPSLDLIAFYKGDWVVQGLTWVQEDFTADGPYVWNSATQQWVNHFGDPGTVPQCPNEDQNRNGVLENGEDLNGNGSLDPSGVTITNLGSTKTDASGKAIVRMEYPRNRASWIDFKITVTASVAGTEGKAVYIGTKAGLGNLPVPGSAVQDVHTTPAFAVSPYGRAPGCTNAN
jgi:hypothetical protein